MNTANPPTFSGLSQALNCYVFIRYWYGHL